MPELPEVETLKRSLEKLVVGHKILSFIKFRENLRYQLAPDLKEKIEGCFIIGVRRVARYLVLELNNNYCIIIHLGMSGRVTLRKNDYIFQKHDHVAFALDDIGYLVFNDPRRFGMVYVSPTSELGGQKYIKGFGPEPFSDLFTPHYLECCFRKRRIPIKSAIMDNRILVGVGNIYASESLFTSRINPLRSAESLSTPELQKLVAAIILVLNQAISAGGTTLRDFVNGENRPGYFKQKLKVYGRKGASCQDCGEKIVKIIQSGRATYLCPACQA